MQRRIKQTFNCLLLLLGFWQSKSLAAISDDVQRLNKTSDKVTGYLEDSQITAQIKSLFLNKVSSDVADVAVSTNQGRVTLTGFVPNQQQRLQLTKLSSTVSGVKQVDNQVQLLANQPATLKGFARDTLITSDIKARLFSNSAIDSANIKVTTRNGEVFLGGTLPLEQIKKVQAEVRQSSDAKRIHNNIKVKE